MRICAVILNYFGAEDTIACARLLYQQKVEHVCVVDNSADANQAARLAGAFAGQERVTLLETDKNIGFSAGVNYGLRRLPLSDFDAVLVVNNDTIIQDGFIKNFAAAACATGLQIAGPRIHHYPNTEKLWSRGSWYNAWFGLVTHRPPPLPGNIFYLTGCCLLIECRVFEEIGLFDEGFFMYGEDVDFCVRAARAGLKTGVIDTAVMFHKANTSSRNNSCFYEHQIVRAHLRLSQRLFTHRSTRALSTCVKIPVLCVRALLRTLRFGNLNALKGLLSGLCNNSTASRPSARGA
jgi:GT2 family glycosyltransferase